MIVAAAGAGPAFGVAAAATAVSVVALVFTRVRPVDTLDRQPLLREVRTGLGYVASHRVLLPLLVLAAVVEFGFSGAINVGLPILAQDRGWGAGGVGVLLGAFGAGATVTALGLIAVGRIPHVGRSLTPIILVMAAGLAAMGLTDSLLFTAASAAMVGAGAGLAGSLYGSLVLTQSTPTMVARVSSLAMLASLGLSPLAYVLSGAVASVAGATAPFLIGGAISALGALVAIAAPALRRAEFPERDELPTD